MSSQQQGVIFDVDETSTSCSRFQTPQAGTSLGSSLGSSRAKTAPSTLCSCRATTSHLHHTRGQAPLRQSTAQRLPGRACCSVWCSCMLHLAPASRVRLSSAIRFPAKLLLRRKRRTWLPPCLLRFRSRWLLLHGPLGHSLLMVWRPCWGLPGRSWSCRLRLRWLLLWRCTLLLRPWRRCWERASLLQFLLLQ